MPMQPRGVSTKCLFRQTREAIMAKKTTLTGNEVMITVTKNDKGETHAVNAANVATVKVAEIRAAEDIRQGFCFNLCTGTADPAIGAAIKSRKLSSLLPTMSRADQNALRALAEVDHIKLQAAWQYYVDNAKRVRGISLQGLRSAYNAFYGDAKASLDNLLTMIS